MGLKDLNKGTMGYAQAEAMHGFNQASYESTEAAIYEAAARIYESGVREMSGQVIQGFNNVRADFAAAAFDQEELRALHKDAFARGDHALVAAAGIVLERQFFMENEAPEHLERIHLAGQVLEDTGPLAGRAPHKPNTMAVG